jgi:hypothetical protein
MLWLILCCQIQKVDEFTLKVEIVNIPQIERDLNRDWTSVIEPIDENSRLIYHVGEMMNARADKIKSRLKLKYTENGDLPGYIINRIRYNVHSTIETPRPFELLEWIISDHLHNVYVDQWSRYKIHLMNKWENEEFDRRWRFIENLNDPEFVYDYYDDEYIFFGDDYQPLTKLGYKPAPKPKMPPRPRKLKRPFFLRK